MPASFDRPGFIIIIPPLDDSHLQVDFPMIMLLIFVHL